MKAIITGDIIESRSVKDPSIWLDPLKALFQKFGTSPEVWDIYRGDSFQLYTEPAEALRISILIKAVIKKIPHENVDVRLAIGIDEERFREGIVSESTGKAYLFSGSLLDQIKQKKVNMAIKSEWPRLDEEINMMLKLALIIMNSWTRNSAEVVEIVFQESGITQKEIGDRLGIVQSSVNDRMKRASLAEIIEFEQYYRKRIGEINQK